MFLWGVLLRVTHTGVRGDNVVRYRLCSKCGKNIKTIELDVERLKYERWWIAKFKSIYKEYEKKRIE